MLDSHPPSRWAAGGERHRDAGSRRFSVAVPGILLDDLAVFTELVRVPDVAGVADENFWMETPRRGHFSHVAEFERP